jgi:hypothetical protein
LPVDPVIASNGVIVEEDLGNPQTALGESGLDGCISETICRFGSSPKNLKEMRFGE